MNDLTQTAASVLSEASFEVWQLRDSSTPGLAFENSTVLGFLFTYDSADTLLQSWQQDSRVAIAAHQFQLRRAGIKAWNAYVVLLCSGEVDDRTSTLLASLEENLEGTRKLVRATGQDLAGVQEALLPLLTLQAAPKLEPVNLPLEIQQQTTELPPQIVQAFLSDVDESVVLQVMEESP